MKEISSPPLESSFTAGIDSGTAALLYKCILKFLLFGKIHVSWTQKRRSFGLIIVSIFEIGQFQVLHFSEGTVCHSRLHANGRPGAGSDAASGRLRERATLVSIPLSSYATLQRNECAALIPNMRTRSLFSETPKHMKSASRNPLQAVFCRLTTPPPGVTVQLGEHSGLPTSDDLTVSHRFYFQIHSSFVASVHFEFHFFTH